MAYSGGQHRAGQVFTNQEAGQWNREDIGIYALNPLIQSYFSPITTRLPYVLTPHKDFNSLYSWVVSQRPRMIIIEAELLEAAEEEQRALLKDALSQWHILSMIIARHVGQIRKWREDKWPNLHFWCKEIAEDFPQKVISLLNERLLLDKPLVYLISNQPHFTSQMGVMLSYYGIRFRHVKEQDVDEIMKGVVADVPEAVLWDGGAKLNAPMELHSKLNLFYGQKNCPILLFDLPKRQNKEEKWWQANAAIPVYKSLAVEQFMADLLDHIYDKRSEKLKLCRDFLSGLYLIDTFREVVGKQLPVAAKRGEEFSILKLSIQSLSEITEKFGSIFTTNLVANLGLFVKNHVRSTDFVACGAEHGEIVIFFERLGAPMTKLVGKRLMNEFDKKMSFEDEKGGAFNPAISFSVLSFPHDLQNGSQLDQFLNWQAGTSHAHEMEALYLRKE